MIELIKIILTYDPDHKPQIIPLIISHLIHKT